MSSKYVDIKVALVSINDPSMLEKVKFALEINGVPTYRIAEFKEQMRKSHDSLLTCSEWVHLTIKSCIDKI